MGASLIIGMRPAPIWGFPSYRGSLGVGSARYVTSEDMGMHQHGRAPQVKEYPQIHHLIGSGPRTRLLPG